jgi:DNA-binding NtrC family response regulator
VEYRTARAAAQLDDAGGVAHAEVRSEEEDEVTPRILIVDDELSFVESVERMLRIEGYSELTPMTSSTGVVALLERTEFDAAILDITMPGIDGLELLRLIKERSPQTECVMVTANESIELVVKAVRLGAYDYLVKPILPEQLARALERAMEHRLLLQKLLLRSGTAAAGALGNPQAFAGIVTSDEQLLRLLHEAELHAAGDLPILVTGETGVGKELLARAIHRCSRRAGGPFVAVNMLALSPTLFESEFFGHAKGAFTGADRERTGYLAQAQHGTLFLDEIGDLSLEIQGKLLRVLQEGEYTPVGKTRAEQADVRFIAATNQELERLVQQRKFRKDLFYRLQFAHLHLPPLRDRRGDILPLAATFLAASGRERVTISDQAQAMLEDHDWPGNVRELRGAVESAANLAEGGVIEAQHLRLRGRATGPRPAALPAAAASLSPLAEVERRHIIAVYEAVGHNKSQAARVLEIGLHTLQRKLRAYGVS